MSKTILVVEDNAMNMKLFCEILESMGVTSLCALDGKTGLALAKEHCPDLILMDMQLPDISGLELTRNIKADGELKHIPVIAVTASVMQGDEERIMASGCDIYVSKPIQIAEFIGVIRKMLDRPAATP
jgi:two-component system cell cycle response regulator DivK